MGARPRVFQDASARFSLPAVASLKEQMHSWMQRRIFDGRIPSEFPQLSQDTRPDTARTLRVLYDTASRFRKHGVAAACRKERYRVVRISVYFGDGGTNKQTAGVAEERGGAQVFEEKKVETGDLLLAAIERGSHGIFTCGGDVDAEQFETVLAHECDDALGCGSSRVHLSRPCFRNDSKDALGQQPFRAGEDVPFAALRVEFEKIGGEAVFGCDLVKRARRIRFGLLDNFRFPVFLLIAFDEIHIGRIGA